MQCILSFQRRFTELKCVFMIMLVIMYIYIHVYIYFFLNHTERLGRVGGLMRGRGERGRGEGEGGGGEEMEGWD